MASTQEVFFTTTPKVLTVDPKEPESTEPNVEPKVEPTEPKVEPKVEPTEPKVEPKVLTLTFEPKVEPESTEPKVLTLTFEPKVEPEVVEQQSKKRRLDDALEKLIGVNQVLASQVLRPEEILAFEEVVTGAINKATSEEEESDEDEDEDDDSDSSSSSGIDLGEYLKKMFRSNDDTNEEEEEDDDCDLNEFVKRLNDTNNEEAIEATKAYIDYALGVNDTTRRILQYRLAKRLCECNENPSDKCFVDRDLYEIQTPTAQNMVRKLIFGFAVYTIGVIMTTQVMLHFSGHCIHL